MTMRNSFQLLTTDIKFLIWTGSEQACAKTLTGLALNWEHKVVRLQVTVRPVRVMSFNCLELWLKIISLELVSVRVKVRGEWEILASIGASWNYYKWFLKIDLYSLTKFVENFHFARALQATEIRNCLFTKAIGAPSMCWFPGT